MMGADGPDLVRVWDRTRSSIEAFDTQLADIRKAYLTVITAIAGVTAGFVPDRPPAIIGASVVAVSFVVVVFTVVFWGLDTRTYGFLRAAVATADRLEKKLGLDRERLGITGELVAFARQVWVSRGDQFLYLFPGASAVVAVLVVQFLNVLPWWQWYYGPLLLIGGIAVSVFYITVPPRRLKRFLDSHGLEDES